ncbi:L-alanine-DL-glutamate epimerase [Bradyrhizobium erythrophlei]|jgi:L-alanine-DL-glutamate epimerase-like enolase superfamily enzyme|nr:L-alanine-DL-glutamate epimerase [Bradyrhizobium erythrophlei]
MRIVDVREAALPLSANIQNSVVNFSEHTVSLVAIVSDVIRNGNPVVGVAFDSIGRFAQSGLMRERFIRRLLAAKPGDLLNDTGKAFDTAKAFAVMMRNEKPGGHGDRAHAVAALELALWDLNAKLNDEPAWKTIASHFGVQPSARMPVYAAGGYYYPEGNLSRLQDEMRRYADMGYTKFKMKIGGASLDEDLRRLEAALQVVGAAEDLAVDANGRFDIPTALAYGKAMEPFALRWYEEPGDPLDYRLMSELAAVYPHRLATGENLFSRRDVENLALFGGMRKGKDLFQMDPALSYGLGEFYRMIQSIEANGFSRRDVHPHGGHMIALHIVVGLALGGSEAYPGVFAPVGGYSDECVVADGGVAPGLSPGFGLEKKADLAPHIAALAST